MNIDIHERKSAEAALREADRQKDEFLALLGHELRNPLAPLSNALALFRKLLPADPKLEHLQAMSERQIQHLKYLVDELLDVARIKTGHIELQRQRLELRDCLEKALEAAKATIEERGHRLDVDFTSEPLPVEGDDVRLVQIIQNLLDNAAKYTPEPGRIRVSSRRDGAEAVLAIADTGVGLAPEMLDSVFDTFVRGISAPHHGSSGLGLGLTLVRRLTELHGGRVAVRSEGRGRGSEFTVRLPLAAASRPAPAAKAVEAPAAMATSRRILVVDDNRDAAESLALLLEMQGYEVRCALDGRSALEIAARFAPAVVVLDIGLPDLDGYALAQALREQAATASARLIALTGYAPEVDRTRSAAAGIDQRLAKPVDFAQLKALLDEPGE
jgi:two-component system CheB/CheR fusion protein